jgi:hypothetical protein
MTTSATGTVVYHGDWEPGPLGTQLHPGAVRRMGASEAAAYGQSLYFSASTGFCSLNPGTVANQVNAGIVIAKLVGPDATAGKEVALVNCGTGGRLKASTNSNDDFGVTDFLTVAYDAGNGVPGKLATYSGYKRSIMGLVLGVADDNTPYIWAGPVGSLAARTLLAMDAQRLGGYSISDAAANTTTSERAIDASAVQGVVTSVQYIGAAITADNTDYCTVTIKRYGSSDAYAAGVTVATYDSRAANNGAAAAFTPKAFTLSATAANLNKLSDDVYTITVAKNGAGQQLIGVIRINGKVI